jgi:hypothetical protein
MQLNPVVRSVLTPVARAVQAGNESALAPSTSLDFINGTYIVGGQLQSFNRITFSRTSNATLTDSNGRVSYAPHNLLTNSEDFEASAWTKNGLNAFGSGSTANSTVAPDGTTTADFLQENSAASNHGLSLSYTYAGGPHTLSVYVKAGGRSRIEISLDAADAQAYATFNLTGAGSTINVGTGASAVIAAVGNDWYRCAVTYAPTAGAKTIRTRSGNSANDYFYTGDGTSGIFIWGAQLNVANAPVNLLTFSEQFDNAVWTKTNVTATADVTTAPNGTTTADSLVENTVNGTHEITSTASLSLITANTVFTASIYVKRASGSRNLRFTGYAGSDGLRALFNLDTLTVTNGSYGTSTYLSGSITSVGNGWFLCTVSGSISAASPIANWSLLSGVAINYPGDGTSGLFLWGAQLNTGSTALPYVATTSSIYLPPSYNSTTPKNLLGFTQEFDNAAWTKSGTGVTANTTAAPDGYATADTLTASATTASHLMQRLLTTVASTSYTYSIYVKYNTAQYIAFGTADGSVGTAWAFVTLDVQSGVITQTSNGGGGSIAITGSVSNPGGGWYRLAVTVTTSATATYPTVHIVNTATPTFTNFGNYSWTANGTESVFIWGEQASNSASVDSYVYNPQAAPTSTAYYGPRIDYDPVTLASRGLLIEEQRTNLLTYSEQFDNAAWTKIDATVTANTAIAPDGTTTADLIQRNNVGDTAVYQGAVVASLTTYTGSVYIKANSVGFAVIQFVIPGAGAYYYINLSTGVISQAIVTYGATPPTSLSATVSSSGNGWLRATFTGTTPSGVTAMQLYCKPISTGTGPGFESVNNGQSIYAWGAQLEAGSFATSYIPTVASQVTRAADNASMLGDNFATWYNQTQGTFVVGFSSQYSGSPGITPTQLAFTNLAGASGFISYWNGAVVSSFDGTSTASANIGVSSWVGPHKVASSYGGATKEICANAGTVGSSAYSGAWAAATGLKSAPSGWVRSISYYPTKLPSTTLQSITT